MSTLKVNSITDTGDNPLLGRRNLLINGAMQVAQRSTSAITVSGAGVYDTLDRWKLWESTGGAFTTEQSSEAPDGFGNSIKCAVTTADTSIAVSEYACIGQNIEALDLQHLDYGTSSAKDLTLSFWVRSSKTGTYTICLDKEDSTTYKYVKEYTISSANTWEKKTILIEPDSNIQASGGAINNDNGRGFRLFFSLAWGGSYNSATDNTWNSSSQFATTNQVNWMNSTSNDFYLTGVQLEVGSVATPFEHRSYGEELARCQRYYWKTDDSTHALHMQRSYNGGNQYYGIIYPPVTMRTDPTFSTQSSNVFWPSINTTTGTFTVEANTPQSIIIKCVPSYDAGSYTYTLLTNNNSIRLDAEL